MIERSASPAPITMLPASYRRTLASVEHGVSGAVVATVEIEERVAVEAKVDDRRDAAVGAAIRLLQAGQTGAALGYLMLAAELDAICDEHVDAIGDAATEAHACERDALAAIEAASTGRTR